MKLTNIVIEDFRRIRRFEHPLTDSLDRPQDRVLLVGPSGCGKTTILDAIGLALGSLTEMTTTRADLKVYPAAIVRQGAERARVRCEVRFSDDEIAAARGLARLMGSAEPGSDGGRVEVDWQYSIADPSPWGIASCTPAAGAGLFKARVWNARLLRNRRGSWRTFEEAGGVFTIDQQRTSLGRYVRADIQQVIEGGDPAGDRRLGVTDGGVSMEAEAAEARRGRSEKVYTRDVRTQLIELGVKAKFPRPGAGEVSLFERICERFADVFAPRRILEVRDDPVSGLNVWFSDGRHEYGFDGLSSGEAVGLLTLTKMVSENIHRSIVLFEEPELHLHPVWQRKLLRVVQEIGKDNQIIATSHSPYLMRGVSPAELIELGDLEEDPRA